MPSFFDKPFEEQVNAAIDEGDAKLVQVLLGPKYCQLWQYWAAHSMVSYNMLAIERAAGCQLSLNVVEKQEKLLKNQRVLLLKQKNLLKEKREETLSGIKEGKELLGELLKIACEEAKEYKDKIVEKNEVIANVRRLFCIPDEVQCAATNYQVDADNNCNVIDIRRGEYNNNIRSNSYEYDFGYVALALDTIGSVVRTSVINECEEIIKETEKAIEEKVSGNIGESAKFSDVVSKADQLLNSENSKLLDSAVNRLPENLPTSKGNVPAKAIGNGFLTFGRGFVKYISSYFKNNYDDIGKLDCVENKIKQLDVLMRKLTEFHDEQEKKRGLLCNAQYAIETNIFHELSDGKLIDKKFVADMYGKLLTKYLECFKEDLSNQDKPSSLLSEDVREKGVMMVRQLIESPSRNKEFNYEMGLRFLNRAAKKTNKNLDVTKVLIANGVYSKGFNFKEDINHDKVKALAGKSINTIFMEVHGILFDFYDPCVNLVSKLPTKSGEFKEGGAHKKIILKKTGNENFQAFAKEFEKFVKDMTKRKEHGRLNRDHRPYYTAIWSLWNLITFFRAKRSAGYSEYERIDKAMEELNDVLTCAMVFNDEGIMYDYISKVETEENETNEDIKGLYRVITGETWAGWWNSIRWHEVGSSYKVEEFLSKINKAIEFRLQMESNEKERKDMKEKERFKKQAEVADKRAEVADKRVEVADKRAEVADKRAEVADKRAEVADKRLELIEKVSDLFTGMVFSSNIDDELREVIVKDQRKIKQEVVGHVMEHNSSPERVLDSIMNGIKRNKNQILSAENASSVMSEVIENEVRSFEGTSTLLNDVNVSCGRVAMVTQ